MGDYLWQILRHICLHIKLYQIPLEHSLFIHVLYVGLCIHNLPLNIHSFPNATLNHGAFSSTLFNMNRLFIAVFYS